MSDDQTREQSIFQAALEKGTDGERNAYLDEVCSGHPGLRNRIEELLKLHVSGGLLDGPPPGLEATIEVSPLQRPEMTIGNYKLMEQIGEGGMGLVYVAQQENPIVRKVALKIIKPGMGTKEVLARFEAERQALAMMDHPNIAKVLDAGTTNSGHPYFVMELVRGVPITEYCDRKRLNTRQRLELFVATCQAIHHAHQKGVIHRDVKPSNVLITEHDGTPLPKVIDFGVAKATNQRLTERTIYTRHQQMVGTPLYMSPEQAELSALDVDTRTDIYSLGVLLYELLTGVTPFDRKRFHTVGYDEIRRIIQEEDPPKPSNRISTLGKSAATMTEDGRSAAKRMSSALRGELDWIVMKAMEKDRSRRYETALGFALDVKRFLNEEAVQACPPSTVYQARKFIRRHRAPVITALSLGLLLCAGVVGTTSGWLAEKDARRDVEAQRNMAQRERRKANAESLAARKAEGEAAARAKQLARQMYLMQVRNADDALLAKDFLRAQNELDACPVNERGMEWHIQDGRIKATIPLRLAGAERPWFSRDGDRLISVGKMGTAEQRLARIWDLSTGQVVADMEHDSNLAILAVSDDEQFVAGGGIDGSLVVWNIQTRRKLWPAKKIHQQRFDGLAFSSDGKWIATANWDRTVKVISASNGEERFTLPPFEHRLRKIVFSPDGRWIAVGGFWADAGTACIIDVEKQKVSTRFPGEDQQIPTFAPSGRQLATATRDGKIFVWNWDGEQLTEAASWEAADAGSGELYSLEYSSDGTRLVSGGYSVRLWDVATRAELATLEVGGRVFWLSMNAKGDKIGLFTTGGIRLWNYGQQIEAEVVHKMEGAVVATRFSADGNQIAAMASESWASSLDEIRDQQGPVVILEAESGGAVLPLPGLHTGLTWADGDRHLVLGGPEQHAAQLVSAKTGDIARPYSGHVMPMVPRAVPSGDSVVSVGWDGTIRKWDIKSGTTTATCSTADSSRELQIIGISPSADRVALVFKFEYAVEIWEIDQTSPIRKLPLPGQYAWRVEFSSDDERVFVGSNDGKLTVFDIESRQELRRFAGHRGEVISIAIGPNDQQIVSGDSTGRIIIWDVERAQRLITLTDAGEAVTSLDWSSDGLSIVAGRKDGTIQVWSFGKSP